MTLPSINPLSKNENKTLLFTSKDIANSSNVVEITSPRKGNKDKIIIPVNKTRNKSCCNCLLFFKK
tara:strand:+ start:5139 stop:5336 length:198 start_codon:yes stop_codon:yes gene_type:complete